MFIYLTHKTDENVESCQVKNYDNNAVLWSRIIMMKKYVTVFVQYTVCVYSVCLIYSLSRNKMGTKTCTFI